ncbi:MAG: DUF2213 domain-containing protein [Alphaproteobacteria bacterium]|nr:DUF2213 domain-containing protein [Alphaproteobacteria bacterium]MBR1648499.1 DUF2213 domain-containing protein [Alphaproteobacteria bacterium]
MQLHNDINFTFDDTKVEGKGRHFVSRFIEPGAVSYGKAGVLKVTKEVLDRFIQSFVGCPIVIKHQNITDDNADDKRVGVVNGVWYDGKDGWFYCDGIIWNSEAIKKIENGWTVSCTYEMTDSTGESGEWHNIHYDDELLDGVFLHLAIVPNPRYEDATIKFNSKDRDNEMLLKLFNGKKIQNSDEEQEMDKNALKNKLMEHINKAVKGKGDIDGQSEEEWYKETNRMLDELAYSESKVQKSNSEDEEDKKPEDKEDEGKKENKCKNNDTLAEYTKSKPRVINEDENDNKDDDTDKKDNRKSNSKGEYEELNRLHNSCESAHPKSDYVSQKERIELGNKLF